MMRFPAVSELTLLTVKDWTSLLLILTSVALAKDSITLEITDFSSSNVELLCRYESDMNVTDAFFNVLKEDTMCMYRSISTCQLYLENKCDIFCMGTEDPKSSPFSLKLDGTCEETMNIRCTVSNTMSENVITMAKSTELTALSDPPRISVNNGQEIEASCKNVQIACTVKNKCKQTELVISGPPMDPSFISHTKQGNRFSSTAITTAIFNRAGNYTITCKEAGKEDYFARSFTFFVEPRTAAMHQSDDDMSCSSDEDSKTTIYVAGILTPLVIILLCLLVSLGIYFRRKLINKKRAMNSDEDGIGAGCLSNVEGSKNIGNIGIGLAWNYFYGYLALILPGMKERIINSKPYKESDGKMSSKFIIFIMESGDTPRRFDEVDERFSDIGPLDSGIVKSRAGHQSRPYRNGCHKINLGEGDDYYFCGEFAAPVLALRRMQQSREISLAFMKQQLILFTDTLRSILQLHPVWQSDAVIFSIKDVRSMAYKLCDLIRKPNEEDVQLKKGRYQQTPRKPVIWVAQGLAWSYYYINLAFIGPGLEDKIKSSQYYHTKRLPTKLFILLPVSCYCHSILEAADEEGRIKYVEKLETLEKDIGGNKHRFAFTIHEISSGNEKYYACVQYCSPVLILHEMEERGLAGLSKEQKEKERKIIRKILEDIITRTGAPTFCRNFELVDYDDKSNKDDEALSQILVRRVKKSLGEENCKENDEYETDGQASERDALVTAPSTKTVTNSTAESKRPRSEHETEL